MGWKFLWLHQIQSGISSINPNLQKMLRQGICQAGAFLYDISSMLQCYKVGEGTLHEQ